MNEKIGYWAFIVGVILALIVGIFADMLGIMIIGIEMWIPVVLVLLGLIVGILNIGDKEINNFLIAVIAIAVVAGANLSTIPMFGTYLQSIMGYLVIFIAPAALVVALKSIYNLGSTPRAM